MVITDLTFTLKDIILILTALSTLLGIFAIFFKISFGQGKAKAREENFVKTVVELKEKDKELEHAVVTSKKEVEEKVSKIEVKVDNHITHISADISALRVQLGKLETLVEQSMRTFLDPRNRK